MDDSDPSPSSSSSAASDLDHLLASAGYRVRHSDLPHIADRIDTLVTSDFPLYNPSDFLPLPLSDWSIPDSPFPLTSPDLEEGSGIRLVHLLLTSAESLQFGDFSLTASLLREMSLLLKLLNTTRGIGKVAGYFIDAISRRLYSTTTGSGSEFENEILYHHFYEASPYLKFAHFTANQAILEAFHGHDRVHVVDFSLNQGLQWPPLIQALALRAGGPPILTITAIGPQNHEIGLKLGQLARSVNVQFTFHGVAASNLDDVIRHIGHQETVAINSILHLHRLIGPGPGPSPIDSVLNFVKAVNPKIVTVVEQEADHNQTGFLDRFKEALHYYSTMFDSLEACEAQHEKALAEVYIQREICNILCCEGPERVERHEMLSMWRARMGRAGLEAVHLGWNAFKQASMLLKMYSAEGYCVEENDGCLTLGWHGRPLIAASAWRVGSGQGRGPGSFD